MLMYQIALIEMRNKGKELRPWERVPAAYAFDALIRIRGRVFVQKRLASTVATCPPPVSLRHELLSSVQPDGSPDRLPAAQNGDPLGSPPDKPVSPLSLSPRMP